MNGAVVMHGENVPVGVVQEILGRLSNGVVAGPDDLMGIGECLNMIEEIEKGDAQLPPGWPDRIREIKALFKAIILETSEDPQRDWAAIQEHLKRMNGTDPSGMEVEEASGQEEVDAAEAIMNSPRVDEAAETGDQGPEEVPLEDPELVKDFIEEAREHLSSIELNMMELESNPGDLDVINAVFRPFHSIKGVAGFLNLSTIQTLSHQVENLLDEARSGDLEVSEGLIEIVLNAVDVLKVLLDELDAAVASGGPAYLSSHLASDLLSKIASFDRGKDQVMAPATDDDEKEMGGDVHEPPSQDQGSVVEPEVVEIQDVELIKDFIEEAKEHLASIELNILELEASPSDKEAINAVFRPFHSIKGVAGFLNLKSIHELSHEVENLLDEARSGAIDVTDSVIDVVLSSIDILKVLLAELEEGATAGGQATLSRHLVEAFLERMRSFDPKGTPVVDKEPPRVGDIIKSKGVAESEIVDRVAEKGRQEGVKIGQALGTEGVAKPTQVAGALREQRKFKEKAASVRVDTRKLDNLVDMVGELVIAQSMVLQNPEVESIKDQKFQKDSVQLRRITAELQRISMSLRMVPIKSTFQKLIRLVRDLSKKSGKSVRLEMRGEETEIDRNMVEEIYEPLVHMIRNAVDHGLETPEEREMAGKDPQGTIYLAADQKGGNIIIELQDDGRGLNVEKIRARAIERGLISPDDNLEEKAIYELIFEPGFSTKDVVSDVSGRGVGMDVVKRSVEQLRGKLDVSSIAGQGTRFELKLPLTMAIIDGMVICVGRERYVVPTVALRESLRPSQDTYITVQGKGEMIKVREQLMPLIRLHELFGVEPKYRNPWEALILVVSEDNQAYCLLADEIVGRQEVVIKSLGASLRNVKGISGGAILGDGKVALILDVKGIVSSYEKGGKNGLDRQRRVA